MEAFIAWLIASPIGKALVSVAVGEAIKEFKTLIAQLQGQIADHEATINQISKNFEKLKGLQNETDPDKIDDAIDKASDHI